MRDLLLFRQPCIVTSRAAEYYRRRQCHDKRPARPVRLSKHGLEYISKNSGEIERPFTLDSTSRFRESHRTSVQLKMGEVGVFGVQLSLIRLMDQCVETARIFPALQNCKELLFVKPDQALDGFAEQGE